jgi:hypothetical protein
MGSGWQAIIAAQRVEPLLIRTMGGSLPDYVFTKTLPCIARRLASVRHAMAASLADTAGQDDRSDRIRDQEDAIDAAQDAAQERRAADQAASPVP